MKFAIRRNPTDNQMIEFYTILHDQTYLAFTVLDEFLDQDMKDKLDKNVVCLVEMKKIESGEKLNKNIIYN